MVAAFGLIALAIYTIPSVGKAFSLATSRQVEPFTELYFTSPDRIEKSFERGSTQTIRFSVRNLEGKSMSYPYTISLDGTVIKRGTIQAAFDQTVRVSELAPINTNKTRAKLTVTLTSTNQSIHYWTEKE